MSSSFLSGSASHVADRVQTVIDSDPDLEKRVCEAQDDHIVREVCHLIKTRFGDNIKLDLVRTALRKGYGKSYSLAGTFTSSLIRRLRQNAIPSQSTDSEEEMKDNFLRGVVLLVDHATSGVLKFLRDVWGKILPEYSIDDIESRNKGLEKLNAKYDKVIGMYVLKMSTFLLILHRWGQNKSKSVDDMDISPLCSILMMPFDDKYVHSCTIRIEERYEDVFRLREARNGLLFHASKCQLATKEYDYLFGCAEKFCGTVEPVLPGDRQLSDAHLKWLEGALVNAFEEFYGVEDKISCVEEGLMVVRELVTYHLS